MLQQLRDQTQSTGFKILVVAIIFVLTLFGFGATNIFMGSLPSIATVGDFDVTEGVLSVETSASDADCSRKWVRSLIPRISTAYSFRIML